MEIKVKLKTKKQTITWNINKFINNIIIPITVITGFTTLLLQIILKLQIFKIY